MIQRQSRATGILVALVGTMSVGALTVPAAHADDPLAPIKRTVDKDRSKACAGTFASLRYNGALEAIAQRYARSEKVPQVPPAGFQRLIPFLGAGDPQAQAINRAYRRGAGQRIGNCSDEIEYGVGFVKHDDRSVSVVTIVFGVLNPPPPGDGKGVILK
jgi:hypothetical protein